MEIPHEDQSSHYDHEKDKFAYLSMRDRIELGKRQVQQSQWGSKYALNGDDSYDHMVGECPTIPTMRDMYGYQSSYTSSWNNHPNLTTQPQPQPSMSTSSLEQAILKISKVMEDFVGEQQKINSHLNEKIDNMESSINVRMEGVYNDLSLRIEKVQDSIEKLTNLDIAMGKRKLPPQPHHNLQGTNAKRSRKVLKIDTLVGDCYDNSMDQPSIENHKVQDDKGLLETFKASTSLGKRRETNSLGPNGKDANFFWDLGGIQHEVGVRACKNDERKGREERILAIGSIATFGKYLEHFLESILYILYTVSKLGKSEVQLFKRKLRRAEREIRTVRIKVRKFSHRVKHSPGTRVAFRTPQAHFHTVRNKVRKFRTVRN
uniref:Uncharacterized protein n=1 Tax=Vitis vinifera TaxID=29760 RepID=A5BBW4_VITVI|nr:hypothetical protein VITISV_015984 [Vitis vinifera]